LNVLRYPTRWAAGSASGVQQGSIKIA
jgi:hypothetical protein